MSGVQHLLGKVIEGDEERDAIHVAVAPVEAGAQLKPGEHVGLMSSGRFGSNADKLIGVVDPFLKDRVKTGQKFWLFLYPGSTTVLRHDWAHPAFRKEQVKAGNTQEAEQWLKDFAEQIGTGYYTLMKAAHNWLLYEEYFVEGGKFEGEYVPEDFWVYYDMVMGTKTPEEKRQNFLSCSC